MEKVAFTAKNHLLIIYNLWIRVKILDKIITILIISMNMKILKIFKP